MSNLNYTSKPGRRITRRHALGAGVALGLGVTSLAIAGCGTDDHGEPADSTGSGLAKASDMTKQAVRGGVSHDYRTTDIQTFDLATTSNYTAIMYGVNYYSRLFKRKCVPLGPAITPEFDGDLVASWEVQDGGLRWVLKLRPGVKMQNVPPLNGRALDVEDVTMSWERFSKLSPRRLRFDFVESVTAPDANTIVVKNNFPMGPFGLLFADNSGFYVMPKEVAQGKVDFRPVGYGSGPWIVDDYQRSAILTLRRNPDYFIPGVPYRDKIEQPIVKEYAQLMAQFRAGNIESLTPNTADIIDLKRDMPDTLMWEGEFGTSMNIILFSAKDREFNAARDVRIRRALSMGRDRDTFLDVFNNVEKMRSAGYAVETRWDNLVSAGFPFYLDPKSKEMGWPDKAPAKWYKHDPSEAKKLLAAAGVPEGFKTDLVYSTIFQTFYGGQFNNWVEATAQMWGEIGLKFDLKPQEFTVFEPTSVGKGEFKGVVCTPYGEYYDEDAFFKANYTPGTDRNPAMWDDPEVHRLIDKQRREFNLEERRKILYDLQKYLSDNMMNIPWAGQTTSNFTFVRPWVMNYRVHRQAPDSSLFIWLDEAKRKK